MAGFVVFHVLTLLLGIGIVTRVVPVEVVSNMLGYLHKTIGITTPRSEQVRTIALIWLGSVIVIVDGCLLLLVFITKLVNSG